MDFSAFYDIFLLLSKLYLFALKAGPVCCGWIELYMSLRAYITHYVNCFARQRTDSFSSSSLTLIQPLPGCYCWKLIDTRWPLGPWTLYVYKLSFAVILFIPDEV
jgi:hypothetical protein